jgi:excisionase family DNA binding protein
MATESHDRSFLSDAQIAELLGVPPATVGWWRRTGKLPFLRAGRHPRVRAADFEAFVAARMHPAAPSAVARLAREARR